MNSQKGKLSPIQPGETLLEEFLKPLGLSQCRLAKDIGVAQIRISQIIKGKRSIPVDTALRFSRYFGTSADVWLGLPIDYDLESAKDQKDRIMQEIKVQAST